MNMNLTSVTLTDQQIEEYETRGLLFFPSLLSLAEIEHLRAALPDVLNADRPEISREEKSNRVRCAFACHTYSDAFARLSRHPRIVEPVRQLLGGDIYMYQFSINPKDGFNGEAWEWHQDYGIYGNQDGLPDARVINTGLFIDEVTQFNGPVFFIPGSHRHGLLESTEAPATKFPSQILDHKLVTELIEEGGLFSPQGPAGSMWIFNSNIVHASNANMSPYNRMIVCQSYAHVENHIRDTTRPEWVAHTDNTPIVSLDTDCLLSA